MKELRNSISHCGMLVAEINFEDDKTISDFKNKILNVIKYIPSKQLAKRKISEINCLIEKHFKEDGKVYFKMNEFFRIGDVNEY